MSKENKRRHGIINMLRAKGRVVVGWWDGEPIHRPMEPQEKLATGNIDEDAAALAILLLGKKDYKPHF